MTPILLLLLGPLGCSSVGGARDAAPRLSTIETDPPGASIYVEGGFVGTSPATFYLPAKPRVELRLVHPACAPQDDILVRRRELPPGTEAEEGVGWEELYYYRLIPR